MNNHKSTAKMRRFLFGYVYITIAKEIGETDIEKIHRWCMGKFACGLFSLKEMDYDSLNKYINSIIIYFSTEYNLKFGENDII